MYAASEKVLPFDEQGKLWRLSQNDGFDQKFAQMLQNITGSNQAKVVHFYNRECNCNPVAEQHIKSVKKLALKQGFTNQDIEVDNYLELRSFLPSTPAIAVFDGQGELVYLGPYSAGYACTVGNGIVEAYIAGRNAKAPGATVLSDTKGCYCPIVVN